MKNSSELQRVCQAFGISNRAVTTIEADEAAASSDFLNNKKRKRKREREKERKKLKEQRQDIDFCSSKGYIRYVMPLRIYFCVRCKMLFQIYFCSQSDVGSFITDFPPYFKKLEIIHDS